MNTVEKVKVDAICGICGDEYFGYKGKIVCPNTLDCSCDNGDSMIYQD